MQREYVIFGGDLSYFSRKLQAALRFYAAPFRFESKSAELRENIETRSGTHQVPVLLTPENWMIADTTPLIALLDSRYPSRRLVPTGPLGVLVHIVEEVLDEWLARVMVHYRWHYAESAQHAVRRMTGQQLSLDEARDFPIANWGRRACRATGTESEPQQKAAEEEYRGILAALERQLETTPYALGERPSAVDAILLGGLRAHINEDPTPKAMLQAYPRSIEWCEKTADGWDGSGELAPFPESTPFAGHVLELARDAYKPFVLGNAAALARGDKAFVVAMYGEEVSYLARPYPEQSRQLILERIRNQLTPAERAPVERWLEARGLADCFTPASGG